MVANICTFCRNSACQPLFHNDPMSDAAPAAVGKPCLDKLVRECYGVALRVVTKQEVRVRKVKREDG